MNQTSTVTIGNTFYKILAELSASSGKSIQAVLEKSFYFLVRVGGLCLYSSGFNRRIIKGGFTRGWSETGFFRVSAIVTKYSRKNPVSWVLTLQSPLNSTDTLQVVKLCDTIKRSQK